MVPRGCDLTARQLCNLHNAPHLPRPRRLRGGRPRFRGHPARRCGRVRLPQQGDARDCVACRDDRRPRLVGLASARVRRRCTAPPRAACATACRTATATPTARAQGSGPPAADSTDDHAMLATAAARRRLHRRNTTSCTRVKIEHPTIPLRPSQNRHSLQTSPAPPESALVHRSRFAQETARSLRRDLGRSARRDDRGARLRGSARALARPPSDARARAPPAAGVRALAAALARTGAVQDARAHVTARAKILPAASTLVSAMRRLTAEASATGAEAAVLASAGGLAIFNLEHPTTRASRRRSAR